MGLNRFAFCAAVSAYLLLLGARTYAAALLGVAVYFSFSVLLLLHVLWRPRSSAPRCVVAAVADVAAISSGMLLGGAATAALYPIYLWVALGNGFRFGLRFLFLATGLGMAGFSVVWWRSPFWGNQPHLAAGLLLGLFTVPLYGAMLIRRLSAARLEAEAANRAKSMVLASVSHSVRTPLNAIIAGTTLLQGTRLDAEQRELAAKLRIGSDVLMLLLGSILDFTRIEAGRMPTRRQPVPIAAVVLEVAELFRQQAEEKELPLLVHIGEEVPAAILTDRHHVTEILVNLLGNAVKFTERGEIRLVLRVEDRSPGGRSGIAIEVSDTGIGIASDARHRIFDGFAQADATIIDRFGGTGLGLAIVSRLVAMLDGSVSVDSVPGRGSRFTVRLDAAAAALPDSGPADPPLPDCVRYAPSRPHPGVEDALRELEPEVRPVCRPVSGAIELHAAVVRLNRAGGGLLLLEPASPGELAEANAILSRADPFNRVPRLLLPPRGLVPDEAARRCATTILVGDVDAASLSGAIRRCVPPLARPSGDVLPAATVPGLAILVADDNVSNQRLVEKILHRAGHHVHLVGNGEDAVIALGEQPFDLALFDLNMPVMNGLDAAQEYQFLALGTPAVPIVALTADATPDTARRCREAGMVDCITKPVVPHELVRRIDALGLHPRMPSASGTAGPVPVADIGSHPAFRPAAAGLDPHALDGLRRLGGDEFVSAMVDAFLLDAESLVDQLTTAAATGDLPGFRNAVHALRSAAANVGANEIHRLCGACREIPAAALPGNGRRLAGRIAAAAALIRRDRPAPAGATASRPAGW
ncbi:MAG: response regulator [Gluconacetobacter diazotrophicus]|nr:response regulator [Gluconacetobacter diazotrophicus]